MGILHALRYKIINPVLCPVLCVWMILFLYCHALCYVNYGRWTSLLEIGLPRGGVWV